MRGSSGWRSVGAVSARIATGLATHDDGVDAFAEAAARAELGLGGLRPDLVMVFAGAPNLGFVDDGVDAVRDRLGEDATLLGCGAQGVVGAGRELEEGGVAVWSASLPYADVEGFRVDVTPTADGHVAISGVPDMHGAVVTV